VTIGELSDNVLLKIYYCYLDASPQRWPILVHICRRWRRIIFASQQALHLRLFCTYGTPVLKNLDCWPSLPIVVDYGGAPELDLLAPEDEVNIMVALKRSDRVCSIRLNLTDSLIENLSAIEVSFSELEVLILQAQYNLPLPNSFWWGTRLRSLELTRITFSALPQLLYSSRELVHLHLYDAFYPSHSSLQVLTDALSRMAQLRSLSLCLPPATNQYIASFLPRGRLILPVLTRLNFVGDTEYLEDLVARIDAPHLGDIEVAVFNARFNESTSSFSKLIQFIDRTGKHKSHRRADILSSQNAISISLIQPGAPTRLKLQLFCEPLGTQLKTVVPILSQFFAFIVNVEDLRINVMQESSLDDPCTRQRSRQECLHTWAALLSTPEYRRSSVALDAPQSIQEDSRWPDLINLFTGVKWFHVAGNHSIKIVRALHLQVWRSGAMRPIIHKLYVRQPGPQHAPLRSAVVTLMTSRRLSGHPIEVEYETHISEGLSGGTKHAHPLPRLANLFEIGPCSQRFMIEILTEDILLNIFRHSLDATPQFWLTLACVCQRWRQIISTSPLGLNIRLYCTHGKPVLKALDYWPALPIIVQYGGFPNLDPPASEEDDNIISALKQSGRVRSISLTVASSLLEKLSAISEPFSELEELALLSRHNMQLTLPSTFRWGPPLRSLHSTRIAFPLFPHLLSQCQDLVDLHLHEIPSTGYVSPEAFANGLSGNTRLRSLSLHFLSFPPRRTFLGLPPQPGGRIVLSALTRLKYRGTSKYLDSFVARIDAPGLGDIDITLFSQPTIDVSELGRFMERIEMQRLVSQANIELSARAISIRFTPPIAPTRFNLQIPCKQLDWQVSSMVQVCNQFSPFLFRVKDLGISSPPSLLPSGRYNIDGTQWPELIRAFAGAEAFHVAGEWVADILCALLPVGEVHSTDSTVLPALRKLQVEAKTWAKNEPSWGTLLSFITSRSISGRPVEVNVPIYQCHVCHASFRQQQGTTRHLVDEHGYRILCSYCGDFECKPGRYRLFRGHLESSHYHVTRGDTIILRNLLTSFELDSIVERHTVLRAPEAGATSNTVTPTLG
jgi:hypothetical protein